MGALAFFREDDKNRTLTRGNVVKRQNGCGGGASFENLAMDRNYPGKSSGVMGVYR
jgi:hypothetical protein